MLLSIKGAGALPSRAALAACLLLAACGDSGDAEEQDSSFNPVRDGGTLSPDSGLDGSVYAPPTGDAQITFPLGDASARDAAGSEGGAGNEPAGLAGTGLTPFATSGQPLALVDSKWTYFEFPDTACRDGSKAGVTIFGNKASTKLMIFFEGGGACFDGVTCSANPANVDATDKAGPTGGVFDRANAANPVKDWNIVYIPYCSGDVFGGTKRDVTVPGVAAKQQFVGYLNTQAFLQRVVPTFPKLTDILVTGVSAGGFGASASVILLQRAFPNVKGKLIDDSGPPMSSKVLASCLQKKWRETWGLDDSMLKDCGAGCPKKDDFTFDYGIFLAKTFSNRLSGLIETAQDGIISGFFGAGRPALFSTEPCTGTALIDSVPGPEFQAGLIEFRDAVKSYPNFGTFLPPGTQHTWLMSPSFYTGAIGDVKLVDWFSDIINDKGTKHVGLSSP